MVTGETPGALPPLDFDLHGLVGVRVLGARPGDAAAVERQLGPLRRPLDRAPDITIRFVERLPLRGPLRYLGVGEAAFTDEAFLVLRSKHKLRARVLLPLDRIGEGLEILCEHGAPAVPLLVPIINLTCLGNGALALHASAFVYEGTGVLCTGWSKGGKTEALLGFAARGASYVGDEWVYLWEDGARMGGIPEPVRIWRWHLEHAPQYRAALSPADRWRLRFLGLFDRAVGRLPAPAGSRFARRRDRLAALVRSQMHADLEPRRLFSKLVPASSPEVVFFVSTHEAGEVVVEELDALEIARRMPFSLAHERLAFMAVYHAFRFAFPERRSALVESVHELERERLTRFLAGKRAYAVRHPYPVPVAQVVEAMAPHCTR